MEDFVASKRLLTPKRLKELSQKTNIHGVLQTASHLGAIAIGMIGIHTFWGSWVAVPFFIATGIMLNFLYAGQHELSHNTVFKAKKWNERVGHLFCFLGLNPREADRLEHYQHHRHTNNPELDAELVDAEPFTLSSYISYLFGFNYWWDRIMDVLTNVVGNTDRPHLSENQRLRVIKEARQYFFIYFVCAAVSVYFQSWILVQLWLAPLLTCKMVQQFQNLTEHTGMPFEDDIWITTRTIRTNFILRWLAWNMPYHTAHHSFPAVPFHRLKELHADVVEAKGSEPETIGYLKFQYHMIRKLMKDGTSVYTGKPITDY